MLLPELFTTQVIEWVCNSAGSGSTITSVVRLKGSTSSNLFGVTLRTSHGLRQLVLRLFTNLEWLQQEPNLAEHEAAALDAAEKLGLITPRLVACDISGKSSGWQAILMTRLHGMPSLQPADFIHWLREQALFLNTLHSNSGSELKWSYFPYVNPTRVEPPVWSALKREWERAIEIVSQPTPPGATCFIHRDFHPMNTLWQGNTLTGVVDWTNACRGPAAFDIAWMRVNLVQMYGVNAAQQFLDQMTILTAKPSLDQRYWDLMALIEFTDEPPHVYPPWHQFGLNSLNDTLIRARLEEHLQNVLIAPDS